MKRMSGEDKITARFMRREYFTFQPTFLILMATNFKPNYRGQDEGLWRRVKLIPFTRFFRPEERDHKLARHLRREAEGILAWAIRGAVEWYKLGHLGEPPEVIEATASYRHNSDALDGFFPGVFVRSENEGDKVVAQEVWLAYQRWADDMELPAKERWTRKTLYAALDERGVSRSTIRGYSTFRGIVRADESEALKEIEPGAVNTPVDDTPVVYDVSSTHTPLSERLTNLGGSDE